MLKSSTKISFRRRATRNEFSHILTIAKETYFLSHEALENSSTFLEKDSFLQVLIARGISSSFHLSRRGVEILNSFMDDGTKVIVGNCYREHSFLISKLILSE